MAKYQLATRKRGFSISFPDFWRLYLDSHRKPTTRGMHYGATLLGLSGTIAAVWLEEPLLCPAGILGGVAMALVSHRFIEHNRPLIRVNPLWGAIADLRMLWLWLSGRLTGEYRRLGLIPSDHGPTAYPADIR